MILRGDAMPSPFPGMDPYLEEPTIWPDFHTSLFVELKKSLNGVLPPGYVAKIDRYVWIHEPSAEERVRLGKPDTYVASLDVVPASGGGATTTLHPPATVVMPAVKRQGNRYLKVLD